MSSSCLKIRQVVFKVLAAGLAFVAGGCAIPNDATPRQIDVASVPAGLRNPTRQVKVYARRQSGIASFIRSIPLTADTLKTTQLAAAELRKPLTPIETDNGFFSEMDASDADFDVVSIRGQTAVIDITMAPGLKSDGTRLAQVVLTLTSLPQVDTVDVVANGRQVSRLIGSNSQQLVHPPLTQDEFSINLEPTQSALVYFVLDSKLVARDKLIDVPGSLDNTAVASADFLRPLVGKVSPKPGVVGSYINSMPAVICLNGLPICTSGFDLDFNADFAKLSVDQQALAIGQALYTLESWRSLGSIPISVDRRPLDEIPIPGGKFAKVSVDKTAYESLLAKS